jgi:hypothetical protein
MRKTIYLQVLLAFLIVFPAKSQNDSIDSYSVNDTLADFGLFTKDDILELSLRFDITNYKKKKPKDEYLDAILTYHISKTDSINKNIRIKSRGEFRNGYCSFPPIYINFKKTEFKKEDLSKLEKVKLVTHCQSGNEDIVFKEYLIYKLYNVLTDSSFRVRLLKINYINTFKKSKPIRSFAFFIEPLDLLAERINSVPVDVLTLSQKNIVPGMMDRVAIFNYMIGNTDWSVPNLHNCKVLVQNSVDRSELGMIVPYDFDYSGLVNATYAVPAEGLGIESVRQRIYLGTCRGEEVYLNAVKEFANKKESFYKVIREFPYLDERTKKDMVRYLDEFYSGFDKRTSIVYKLLNECKNF